MPSRDPALCNLRRLFTRSGPPNQELCDHARSCTSTRLTGQLGKGAALALAGFSRGGTSIVAFKRRRQPASIAVEDLVMRDAPFLESKLRRGPQHIQAIHNAAAEVDGGGFRKILGWTRNL